MVPEPDCRQQMDDHHENVIDGTARARQWRRAKSKTRSATDDAAARSDAPKSIASSLLVPAEMLPAAFPPDERPNASGRHRAAAVPSPANAGAGDRASAETGVHQNPFLVPEAARVEHRSRSTRRRMIAALLARPRGLLSARRGSSRPLRRLAAMPRWLDELRLTRLLALAALTGAVVVTAVIATRPNAAHPSFASARGATGSLTTPERGSIRAASSPFAQQAAARDRAASHRMRRVRADWTVGTHRRPRPASKPAVVPARYTPPSDAGSSVPSSATSSDAGAAPTAAPSQPAPSSGGGTTSSSSSGSSRPAFGENGTLGPGRGAPSTQ
jgi:hypothetical protein